MRQVVETRRDYHLSLVRLCDNPSLYLWLSLYGGLAALAGAATPSWLLVAFESVVAVSAAVASSCRAYLGLRRMLPSVIYAHAAAYIPAFMVTTILYSSPLPALASALLSALLVVAAIYDEKMATGRSPLLTFMLDDGLENTLLAALGVAGSIPLYMLGANAAAAFAVSVAFYPLYASLRWYFSNIVEWRTAPPWEKTCVTALALFFASLAAFYVLS